MSRDESFFTTHTFNEICNENNKQEYTQTIVKQLRSHWSSMSQNSRNMCWLRFEVLFKISDKIIEASQSSNNVGLAGNC
jgi:ribosome-associated toxin RatA of RatAB toxin-antitoxin module